MQTRELCSGSVLQERAAGASSLVCTDLNVFQRHLLMGVMNEELTLYWVRSVLGRFSFTRRMLAFGLFKCHLMEIVKQKLLTSKIHPLIIPGGCTKYIQAPDVSWNKPFKANVTEKHDGSMVAEAHSFTPAGNMRAPSRREIVRWNLAAWDSLDKREIINSS